MASRQIAQTQMTNANPDEPLNLESQLVHHAADLPVNSLSQDDSQPRGPECLHFFHSRPLAVEHYPGQ